MSGRRKDRLEQAIEDALAPGTFIGQRNSWSFVENLEVLKTELDALVKRGRGARAAANAAPTTRIVFFIMPSPPKNCPSRPMRPRP